MGTPVVVVASGGLPVVEATNGLGVPVTVASNGYGRPVTLATNGYGMPVVPSAPFVDTGAPANVFTPIVSVVGGGAPIVDEILVCSQGSWTHSPTGYAYQWYRTGGAEEEEDPFVFVDSISMGGPAGGGTFSTGTIDTTGATLLIVGITDYQPSTAPIISDNKGNTWTALTSYSSASTTRGRIYYSIPTSVGPGHSVIATGTGFFGSVSFAAFSGPIAPVFDLQNGASGVSIAASAGTGITPGTDHALIIAIAGVDGGTNNILAITPGSPIFELVEIITSSNDHFGHALAYSIQTTPVTADPDWTLNDPSSKWIASIASFNYG